MPLARVTQVPVPVRVQAVLFVLGQAPLRGHHDLHAAEILELRAWQDHFDVQVGFARGKLELDQTIAALLHDADEAPLHVEGLMGDVKCSGHACIDAESVPVIEIITKKTQIRG